MHPLLSDKRMFFAPAAVLLLAAGALLFLKETPAPLPLRGVSEESRTMGAPGFAPTPMGGKSQAFDSEAPAALSADRKIIRNGSLELIVDDADAKAEEIRRMAERFTGFVEEARVFEGGGGVKTGMVSVRIPAARFEEAMAELKRMAIKVESENVSSADVSEQYADFEAQLRNFRAEEAQYLAIMQRANTVEDTLRVAEQLSRVRGNIERIDAQLTYLSRQVDMSRISATLTADADIRVLGIRWRPLYEMKKAFRAAMEGVVEYVNTVIALIFMLPVLLLWMATAALGIWFVWKVIRWLQAKFLG